MATTFKFVPPGTVKQGYLVKSPPLDKTFKGGWKKRWCVFTVVEGEPSLDYYKDEEEAMSTLPINRISLTYCSQIISEMRHKNRKYVFALQLPERMYYFAASSYPEMTEWVDAFSEKLNLTPVDGSTLPVVSTPPLHRASPDETRKSATMPATLSNSPIFPRIRTPDSPLPPIPGSPEMSPRPKPPTIPVPPIPGETSGSNTFPRYSPCASPLLEMRSSSAQTNHYENGHFSHSEGSKVTLSVANPPVPPPHKSMKGARSSSDEEDDEVLSPPTPPPRRASPAPSDLSPPLSPPFEMEMDFPPPIPPPRDSPSHDSSTSVT